MGAPLKVKRRRPPVKRCRKLGNQQPESDVGLIHEKLVGRFIIEWSKLEASFEDLIWRILDLNDDDGRVLTTKLDAKTRIEVLRVLAPRYFEGWGLVFLLLALNASDDVREHRNFITHGVWGTILPSLPIALSLKPKSELGEIIGQSYPREQMYNLIATILNAKRVMVRSHLWLDESRSSSR